MAEPDEQQRASKVDAKCPGAGEREGHRSRRHGGGEFVPGGPQRSEHGNEQNGGKRHSQPRAIERGPAQGYYNQEIERGILEEIDTVGKERHRADCQGDGELDTEISKVEERDQKDGLAQGHGCWSLTPEGRSAAGSWLQLPHTRGPVCLTRRAPGPFAR